MKSEILNEEMLVKGYIKSILLAINIENEFDNFINAIGSGSDEGFLYRPLIDEMITNFEKSIGIEAELEQNDGLFETFYDTFDNELKDKMDNINEVVDRLFNSLFEINN